MKKREKVKWYYAMGTEKSDLDCLGDKNEVEKAKRQMLLEALNLMSCLEFEFQC